jgi:hypothetical protein
VHCSATVLDLGMGCVAKPPFGLQSALPFLPNLIDLDLPAGIFPSLSTKLPCVLLLCYQIPLPA